MLVIGRSYWVVPIQDDEVKTEAGTKLTEETTEKSETGQGGKTGEDETTSGVTGTETAGIKLIAYRGGRAAGTKTAGVGAGI